MAEYRYYTYGLTIASEWCFPELELAPAPATTPVDLYIRQAALAGVFESRAGCPDQGDGQDIFIEWQDVALFIMRGGHEILFDPRPEIPVGAIRLILLGICLGISLHQRGTMVLHGSAVEVHGRALAFMGAKEAGKSTMVASMIQHGYRLIADDLVVVRPQGGRHMLAPGYPSLKIWPQTAIMLGLDLDKMPVLHELIDKRWMMVGECFRREPIPLSAMVILEEGDGPRLEPAHRGQALMRVVEQTYALRFLGKRGATADYFSASSQLVRDVPVVRLIRPLAAEQLDAVVDLLQDWATTLPDLN